MGCKHTFTRKWNAERHNLIIHDEMTIVYNKETGKISDKSKTNNYSSSSSPSTTTAKTRANAFTNTRQIPYPFDNNPEEFDSNNPHSEVNKNIDEVKVFKIFEKISALTNELDTLLTKYEPARKNKDTFRCN